MKILALNVPQPLREGPWCCSPCAQGRVATRRFLTLSFCQLHFLSRPRLASLCFASGMPMAQQLYRVWMARASTICFVDRIACLVLLVDMFVNKTRYAAFPCRMAFCITKQTVNTFLPSFVHPYNIYYIFSYISYFVSLLK